MTTVLVGEYGKHIPSDAGSPNAEQDDDGRVSVHWTAADRQSMFTLTIFPDGKVMATKTEMRSAGA